MTRWVLCHQYYLLRLWLNKNKEKLIIFIVLKHFIILASNSLTSLGNHCCINPQNLLISPNWNILNINSIYTKYQPKQSNPPIPFKQMPLLHLPSDTTEKQVQNWHIDSFTHSFRLACLSELQDNCLLLPDIKLIETGKTHKHLSNFWTTFFFIALWEFWQPGERMYFLKG